MTTIVTRLSVEALREPLRDDRTALGDTVANRFFAMAVRTTALVTFTARGWRRDRLAAIAIL